MTTQGGTDWELREAENAIIAAGDDPVARAVAFRRHAEAIRNMMQSALVPSFVQATSTLMESHTVRILTEVALRLDQQQALVMQLLAMQKASDAHAKRALAVAEETTRGLKKLNTRVQRMESTDDDRSERLKRIEQAVVRIGHEALINELSRTTRLRNVVFLNLLMTQFPDLAAEADRQVRDDE